MASIDSYNNVTPTDGDKILGTDATDGTTKNFLLTALKTYFTGIANLVTSYTSTTATVQSSSGTDATIAQVVAGGNAGVMSGADKSKLDAIETGATGDQTGAEVEALLDSELGGTSWKTGGATNLSTVFNATTVDVNSDTGTDITLSAALPSGNAGVLTGADKQKLDDIDTNAADDQTGTEIVALIDAELGNTTWQSGGGGGGPTAAAYGFNGTTNQVQWFELASNTTGTVQNANLFGPIDWAGSGVGNTEMAIFSGGYVTDFSDRTSDMRKYEFSTEVMSLRGVDTVASTQICGGHSISEVFFFGGNISPTPGSNTDTTAVRKLNFADTSNATSHGAISGARRSGSSANDIENSHCYSFGMFNGNSWTGQVYKIDFPTTTHPSSVTTLANNRNYPISSNADYQGEIIFAGGRNSGSYYSDIYSFSTSTDTATDSGNSHTESNLADGQGHVAASDASTLFMPSVSATTRIARIDRSTKTQIADHGDVVETGHSWVQR